MTCFVTRQLTAKFHPHRRYSLTVNTSVSSMHSNRIQHTHTRARAHTHTHTPLCRYALTRRTVVFQAAWLALALCSSVDSVGEAVVLVDVDVWAGVVISVVTCGVMALTMQTSVRSRRWRWWCAYCGLGHRPCGPWELMVITCS